MRSSLAWMPLVTSIAVGFALALAVVLLIGGVVLAADPTASAPAVELGGDPRSEGSGPGLVGSPLLVLAAVIGLGLGTVLLTVLVSRLARRP